jgi:hypothetical protein
MHTALIAAHATPLAAEPAVRDSPVTASPATSTSAPASVSGVSASPNHSTDSGQTSNRAPPRATVYASPSGACRNERASENR